MRADQSAQRLAALRGRLVDLELDGVVVTSPENIRYLSGFSAVPFFYPGPAGYDAVVMARAVGSSKLSQEILHFSRQRAEQMIEERH